MMYVTLIVSYKICIFKLVLHVLVLSGSLYLKQVKDPIKFFSHYFTIVPLNSSLVPFCMYSPFSKCTPLKTKH